MSRTSIVISVDMGTTQIKAAAFDQELNCLGTQEVENRLLYPSPGLVEQDPEWFVEAASGLIGRIVQHLGPEANRVCAIVGSGQMSGILAIDQGWSSIHRYYTVLDPRSNTYHPQVEPYLDRIISLCGGITHQLEKLLWWRDCFAADYARACKFVTPHVYVLGKLAGLTADQAYTDKTYSCINGLMNVSTWDWEQNLLDAFDIPRAKLPVICDPEQIVGTIHPAWAQRLGLPGDVIFLAGSGDGPATYSGAGVCRPGMAVDLCGTACAFGIYVERFNADLEQRLFISIKSPIMPGWYLTYVNQYGRSHRWFVEEFFPDVVRDCGGDFQQAYALLDQQATQLEPGSSGMLSIAHLSGRSQPPKPYYRGCFAGYELGFTRHHFYRAILEGLAFEYALAIAQQSRHTGIPRLDEIIVLGGGSKSDVWNQLKADVLGATYRRVRDSSMLTLRGDALIAAKAMGWPAFRRAFECADEERRYLPRAENTARYAGCTASFARFDAAMDGVFSQWDD